MPSTIPKQVKILVINPNSSTSITEDFRGPISKANLPNTSISYWTNSQGPAIIENQYDINETFKQCLDPLLQLAPKYDGFLMACFANHTLTSELQRRLAPKPVIGIFDSGIITCYENLLPGRKFAVLTTSKEWEEPLNIAINRILEIFPGGPATFAGVIGTGVTAGVLAGQPPETIRDMFEDAVKQAISLGVTTICVGGVILSINYEMVKEACIVALGSQTTPEMNVIEPIATGILVLRNLIHTVA